MKKKNEYFKFLTLIKSSNISDCKTIESLYKFLFLGLSEKPKPIKSGAIVLHGPSDNESHVEYLLLFLVVCQYYFLNL